MSNKEDLPSINDYLEDSELPSYKDFIEEEKELPSVEEYKTHIEEETIEDANGNTFAEVIDVIKAPEWQELVKLVNDVRKDIPEIPEIKSYDEEIGEISEKIAEIQENFSQYDLKSDKIYDLKAKNEQFEVKLSEIEQKIPEVPEVRYYEGDIELIYSKISRIKEEIESLPEVKYYENDLDVLKSRIEEVNDNIPTFPKWVNEVNEVPDFSWIGKTFGVIDDDFKKVESNFDLIKDTIASRVSELIETIEVKDFEQKVDFKDFKNVYSESKDKIYKELKEITLRIYDHKHEFKDDDRKLKKAILGEQNKLKQTLETEIKRINKESVKTDETILSYFTNLKEEVSKKFDSLPEIKHYDNEIDSLKQDVKFVKVSVKNCLEDIKKISADIKKTQVDLAEGLLNEPPSQKETAGGQTDPLTPLDQKFATLDDLSKHYRLFVNRIQTQLSTMGGGGAGFIKDLDDVTFEGINNQLLIYNSTTSKWVGIASTALGSGGSVGAAGTWAVTSVGIHTTKNVGIATTARSDFALYVQGDQFVDGNITVGGTITYEEVKHVDSLGFSTFRDGLEVNTGTATTALLVKGDARITGILTIGTGSITLNPNTKEVTGIDEIVVGSGASLSLAPLLTQSGKFSVDYSRLTLKGYSSLVNGTYIRQSNYFVLSSAPTASGSARFQSVSDYYYFLHESDNSKMIIYNLVDGYWSVVVSNGSNFSSPSNGQLVNPVTFATIVTYSREGYDDTGRAYPGSGRGIEYATVVTDQRSSLGIATASSLEVSGIITATSFSGSGANITGDIISGGKLLVGTDTEGAALADNLTVADSGDCGVTIRSGNTNYGSIYFSDATSGADEYRGQIEYNHNTDILRIYSGGTAVLRIDPGKLDVIGHTETDSLKVTGLSTFTGSIDLPDSSGDAVGKALFGDSNDLKIYHDGANSYISDVGTGDLRLSGNIVKINNNNNTATMVKATEGGSVELNHNGTKKFETTASGIDVTGHTETDSLEVSGIATVSTAFYMPQYTTTARDAATFNEGAMIYNTTTKKMEFYDGTSWTSLPGMSLGLTVALDG